MGGEMRKRGNTWAMRSVDRGKEDKKPGNEGGQGMLRVHTNTGHPNT